MATTMSHSFQKALTYLPGAGPNDMTNLSRLLQENSMVLYETDKAGHSLLMIAVLQGVPSAKLEIMLQVEAGLAEKAIAGRYPLHMAIENTASHDVLTLLIDTAPKVVSYPDRDGRYSLHMLFEYDAFEPAMFSIIKRIATIHPSALQERVLGKLPLHMCLERAELPAHLVCYIISGYRAGASQHGVNGWLPLHTAVENGLDATIVVALMDAFPAAMFRTVPGTDLSLLEYSLSHKKANVIMECLINGSPQGSRNPRVIACCHSAAIGQVSRPYGKATVDEDEEEEQPFPVSQGAAFSEAYSMSAHSAWHSDASVAVQTMGPNMGRSAAVFFYDMGNVHPDRRKEYITLNMSVRSGGLMRSVLIHPQEQVAQLKQLIERRFRISYSRQRLMLGELQLMPSYRISDYGIDHQTEIRVEERAEGLHYAIKGYASPGIQMALLQIRPMSASEEDAGGCLPLHLAVQRTATSELVERLVDEFPKAVLKGMSSGKLGEYPLHVALDRCYPPSVIAKLLKATNRNSWSPNGNFNPSAKQPLYRAQAQCGVPLHIAIRRGLTESVKLLLDHGCPIEARDESTGYSALECALSSTSQASTELFDVVMRATLSQDPSAIEAQGSNGERPLHVAVQNGAPVAIVQNLLALGPHVVSQTDAYGNLPLHLAIRSGASFSVVRTLLQGQPQAIYFADRRGRTPLLLAVMYRAPPGVVFEIGRFDSADGGAFDVKDHRGRGVLEVAVSRDAPPHILNEILSCTPFDHDLDLLSRDWPDNDAARHALQAVMRRRMQTRTGASSKPSDVAIRGTGIDGLRETGASPQPDLAGSTSTSQLVGKVRQPRGPAVKAKERPAVSTGMEEEPTWLGLVTSMFSWS